MPDFLPVEGAAVAQVLVVHSPARVAAIDDIDPACPVAAVRVVVAGEQVALVVEGEGHGSGGAGREQGAEGEGGERVEEEPHRQIS